MRGPGVAITVPLRPTLARGVVALSLAFLPSCRRDDPPRPDVFEDFDARGRLLDAQVPVDRGTADGLHDGPTDVAVDESDSTRTDGWEIAVDAVTDGGGGDAGSDAPPDDSSTSDGAGVDGADVDGADGD